MDWDNFCNLKLLRKYSSVANDILKWLKDVWIYCPVSSPRILVGRLYGNAYVLGLKFKHSRLCISSFVQHEMKNESSLGGGKYWKKFYINMAPDWTFAATKQKKLLKIFAIVCGSVTYKKTLWPLFMDGVQLPPQLFKSFEFGNGSRISDENLVILEFKYLQNKKW